MPSFACNNMAQSSLSIDISSAVCSCVIQTIFLASVFFTQHIPYIFAKLIWSAVTPFRLHIESLFQSSVPLFFPCWLNIIRKEYIAAVNMVEKCSKHSQSVHFLLFLKVELRSSGVQQI